ncbi:transposable element Tcb1 transposase [Trichonephila clavipes]|nr:transposable element Tcb1 transposase [Trichonephila clavipes]
MYLFWENNVHRSRRSLRVLPVTSSYRRLHLEWCGARLNWIAEEWNKVVFRDESRFNLSSDDNRVRVWRPRGKGFNPTFAIQRRTVAPAGVMTERTDMLPYSNAGLHRNIANLDTGSELAFSKTDAQMDYTKTSGAKHIACLGIIIFIYLDTATYRVFFSSDEAHFWLNGYVNKQNCRIWREANPQVYVETPLHPEKLTVWCALWAGGILLHKR